MSPRIIWRAFTATATVLVLAIAGVVYVAPPQQAQAAADTGLGRLAGSDRYSTSVAVSRSAFPQGGIGDLYIASGANFPDALAAAPAAFVAKSPVLLTRPNALSGEVEAEVRRLNPNRVVVIGGAAAVSDQVANRLKSLTRSKSVLRVWGKNRSDTAIAVSRLAFPGGNVPSVFVVAGGDYPDAVSASPIAAAQRSPVLLTNRGVLTNAALAELRRLRPGKVVIVGGTGVVSPHVERQIRSVTGNIARFGGANRYQTSAKLSAAYVKPGVANVYLAAGNNFPDALAAGPVAAIHRAPVLLTRPSQLPVSTYREVTRLGAQKVNLVGGDAVVSGLIGQEAQYSAADTARFLQLVNDHRRANGLAPVSLMAELTMVARDWSVRMVSVGLSHNPNYKKQIPGGWRLVGEIVAFSAKPTPDEMFRLWKESPPHNEIMLNPEVNRMGFSMWRSADVWKKFHSGTALFAKY